MSDVGGDLPQILPNPWVLDDLELVRQGVAVPLTGPGSPWTFPPLGTDDGCPTSRVVLIEPEGVAVAEVTVQAGSGKGAETYVPAGTPLLLARRPDRPFERRHLPVDAVNPADVTFMLDRETSLSELAAHLPDGSSALVLLVAALERDGEALGRDVALVRHAERVCEALRTERSDLRHVDLSVVPVARDHPQRDDRLAACATAYARGRAVIDLTGPADEQPVGPGAVLFFTGLSGSGKSTLAKAVRNVLLERTERSLTLLDGDVVRRNLSAGLGFSPADRDRNIRRIGWVAARIAEHGGLAICSPIAPYDATRQAVATMTRQAGGRFLLVHVATPLAECERRDRKGLYARARRGEIPDFTGISSPYEEPVAPDLRLDTTGEAIPTLVERIIDLGARRGAWSPVSAS